MKMHGGRNRFFKWLLLVVALVQLVACGSGSSSLVRSGTAPAITSANSKSFIEGSAGTFTVTATGTPTPILALTGALPSGVSFNASTGVLSGTPAVGSNGTYPLTVTASNGVSPNATQSFTLTVVIGFSSITRADILAQASLLSSAKIDGNDDSTNKIPTGTIVIYKTTTGLYGKFLVVTYGYDLVIDWVTFNADGTVHSQGNNLTIHGTFSADLNNGAQVNSGTPDFFWEQNTSIIRSIDPQNGATFFVWGS